MLTPTAFLYALAQLFPKDFRVICLRCSWYRDYSYRFGDFAADDEGSAPNLKPPRHGDEDRAPAPP